MKKLATVTALRADGDGAARLDSRRADQVATRAYWERVALLRAELARLRGAG